MVDLTVITNTLLSYPVAERAQLAKTLADSVDDFIDPRIDESWELEIENRIEQVSRGEVDLVEPEDVESEVLRKLDGAREISSARKR